MAELATLARPYGKAAFDYAAEHQQVEQWANGLKLLCAIVQDDAFSKYLQQPGLTKNQKAEALVLASNGQISGTIRNFVQQLAENDRLALLPFIEAEFERLKALGSLQQNIVIESAYPLTDAQMAVLRQKLEARYGGQVTIKSIVKPELLAGVVIRAGDQVIDDSVADKLEQMRNRLLAL